MACRRNINTLIIIAFLFLLFTCVYAKVIIVNVGGNGGVLKFDPQNVTDAVKGDTIQWSFQGGNHNIVQSDGIASCVPSQNIANPFNSTTNPPNKIFEHIIQEEKATLFYFCSYASHCQNGMWGVIYVGGTAPSSSATQSASPTVNATPSATNSATKFVGDFKLLSFATFTVFSLIKFLI